MTTFGVTCRDDKEKEKIRKLFGFVRGMSDYRTADILIGMLEQKKIEMSIKPEGE